jgi:hypothetical protein
LCRGGFLTRARRSVLGNVVGGVTPGDAVDRVEHRQVHDRSEPGLGRDRLCGVEDGLFEVGIPVRDHVATDTVEARQHEADGDDCIGFHDEPLCLYLSQ